jgi:hypothetical protein
MPTSTACAAIALSSRVGLRGAITTLALTAALAARQRSTELRERDVLGFASVGQDGVLTGRRVVGGAVQDIGPRISKQIA